LTHGAGGASALDGQFEWVGGQLCLDFLNTVTWRSDGPARERLGTYTALSAWAHEAGLVTNEDLVLMAADAVRRPDLAQDALDEAHALRALMHVVFVETLQGRKPTPRQIALLNDAIQRAHARRCIEWKGAQLSWRWDTRPRDLAAILSPVVGSAAELLTGTTLSRVALCANPDCGWLFLDETRSRTRRWCSMRECGSRAKARRYHARQRARGDDQERRAEKNGTAIASPPASRARSHKE
jgi:predicted RNA-binding Zn ribbon-like protein